MTALLGFLAITVLGALGAFAIVTVSPTLTGILTSALVLAITVTMGAVTAVSVMERPRAQRRASRIDAWLGEIK